MRRTALIILDGAGYSTDPAGNGVRPDTLPRVFAAMEQHGFTTLKAHEDAVGLEPGQVGNSEVGHLTIGAGRAVLSMTRRLAAGFESGSWAEHPAWSSVEEAGVLHLVGLLSDAGVHGLVRTIVNAATIASGKGVDEIVVHPVLDGVDSRAGTAPALLDQLEAAISPLPSVSLGVVHGRKTFCDRSGDLTLTRATVDALRGSAPLPPFRREELEEHLQRESEMSFPPRAWGERRLRDGEPVLITNNRADRVRQVIDVLGETQRVFTIVDPGQGVRPPEAIFFPIETVTDGVAGELVAAGITSARVAEKCKFPHVTFFYNGFDAGAEGVGHQIPSVAEHEIAERPEMGLAAVTERVLERLADPTERYLVVNICNLDQVGHLGRLDLIERAAAAVDDAYGRIEAAAREHGWTLIVTSDHGCGDRVIGEDGAPFGSHTTRPVPLFAVPAPGLRQVWVGSEGTLQNVAASCLDALGLTVPSRMQPALVRFEPLEEE
ncbi:MAG: hypothetical protein ACO4BJ_04785 [Planctomycetota bacterium]